MARVCTEHTRCLQLCSARRVRGSRTAGCWAPGPATHWCECEPEPEPCALAKATAKIAISARRRAIVELSVVASDVLAEAPQDEKLRHSAT